MPDNYKGVTAGRIATGARRLKPPSCLRPMCASSINADPQTPEPHEALRFLDGRINYERGRAARTGELKLDGMRELLARLGDPQNALPVVHVAGTKGKGSTAAMVGAVLSAAGHRTGVFTSPHLNRLEERIAIDGQPCASEELRQLVGQVQPAVEAMDRAVGPDEHGPTYFEIVTAMAMLQFARRNVDAAVLEVGLGGRLDSTNVCRPCVCAITSVSFDHTRQLGRTLESIASEKAGIIKPGVPTVSGVREPESRAVIRRACQERGSRLVELGVDFDLGYQPPRRLDQAPSMGVLDVHSLRGDRAFDHRGLSLRLLGRHQAANAAVAVAVWAELRRAGWKIPEPALREGLAQVVWPARVEIVARHPTIVLDSAHNAASVDALVRTLDESFVARRRRLIFAASKGKDIRGMLRRLLGRFDDVVFTQYVNNPRAVPPHKLAALAAELTEKPYRICPRSADAWETVRREAAPEDLICVTGSLFMAAEIRRSLTEGPAPTPASVPAESEQVAK